MENVEAPVTDRAYQISVVNGTAVNVCVFNVSDYHQVDLFVRIERM